MKQYNKAIVGGGSSAGMTFLIVLTLLQVAARNFDIKISEAEMWLLATGLAAVVGFINTALVYRVPNLAKTITTMDISEQTPPVMK